PVDLRDLAIDGDDLRRAGVPAGPGMGRVLHALLDWVLEDPARNVPAVLAERARALHREFEERRG
ncbi:MAG: polynucleotide adenylyltransferase, partial [Gemmatimonadota bacterium]|nr:polynucleotide adenylyltransferase [Gemmatimonadota bacterium]